MKERFLITGATGFVGSALTRFLVGKRQRVSVIVRKKKVNWRLQDIEKSLDIHVIDLLDPNLEKTIQKINPTIVFHLAAYGASPTEANLDTLIDVNIKGLTHLLHALKKTKVKTIVNTGSSSEYGVSQKLMKETDILNPVNDYGVTKAAMTLFSQKIAAVDQLPVITFRLFSPYGYFESKERFVPTVVKHMLSNKPFELSSPNFVRDFIFIDDVVEAYMHAVDHAIAPGTIINIGSGKEHSLADVVSIVQKYTKSTSKVAWNPKKTQSRQVEPRHWEADIRRAKKLLHWKPKYTLDMGIKKTVQWMRVNEAYYSKSKK